MAETSELDLESGHFPDVPLGALLRLSGKGGPSVVRKLQEALRPLLAVGKKYILFDCARLEFFNSTAFAYLVNLSDLVREAGGNVGLCRVPLKVQVALHSLGLKGFFEIFADESEAALSFRKHAAPEEVPHPSAPVRGTDAAPEKSINLLPPSVNFALPAWLDEVDKPGPAPLDHLRWSALLQSVLRHFGPESLAGIPKRAIVPADSPPSLVARAILRGLQSPEELLGHFEETMLRSICQLYGITEGGGKEDLISSLISFVERTNTVILAGFMEENPQGAASPAPTGSLEPTNESLLKAIETCPFPKPVKSERSARDLLSKHLAKIFGRDQVTANRVVGRHLPSKVDLDVLERFGILVHLGKSVLGKKPSDTENVEKLLGQVVLLAGAYGRGNLFIVLVGEIPKNPISALGELRGWLESVGGRYVQRS